MLEKKLDEMNINSEEEVYELVDSEGKEKEYRKILEFTNPLNNKLYFIFTEEKNIDNYQLEIFPMECIEEEGNMRFEPLENDEEFDMVAEVLDILYSESEEIDSEESC